MNIKPQRFTQKCKIRKKNKVDIKITKLIWKLNAWQEPWRGVP